MTRLIDWFSQRPLAANTLMVLIFVVGTWAIIDNKREILPRLQQDGFTLQWPTTDPTNTACDAFESALLNVGAIEQLYQRHNRQGCQLIAELPYGSHMDTVMDSAETALAQTANKIGATAPTLEQHERSVMITRIAIAAMTHPQTLHNAADLLQETLLSLGLEDVRLRDRYTPRLEIRLNTDTLINLNLSAQGIQQQLIPQLEQLPPATSEAMAQQQLASLSLQTSIHEPPPPAPPIHQAERHRSHYSWR